MGDEEPAGAAVCDAALRALGVPVPWSRRAELETRRLPRIAMRPLCAPPSAIVARGDPARYTPGAVVWMSGRVSRDASGGFWLDPGPEGW
jgi:hypothetical protein